MSSSFFCLPKELGATANVTANGTASNADDALSVYELVVYAVLATAASGVTAFGNLLVLVSFRMDRQLQTVSNYYLMSLAVADLLIGFVSMPIYTVYLLVTYWPFDIIVCNLYLCFDYTMCNASVASLLIISIDRYRSVTSPLVYRGQRTPKRALIMISCAWAVSIVLWSPFIILSSVTKVDKVATVCQVEFINDNPYLTFFTSIMAFFLPVTVMTVLYVRIFRETKKRQRELQNLQAGCGGGCRGGSSTVAASSTDESRKHSRRRRFDTSAGGSLLRRCVRGLIDSDDDAGSGDNNDGDSGGGGGAATGTNEEADCGETLREDRPVFTQHFPRTTSYFRVNYQSGRRGQPAESSLTLLPGNATYPDMDDRIEEVDEQPESLTYVVWIRLPDPNGQTRIQLRSKRATASCSEQQLSTRCLAGQAGHSSGQPQPLPKQQQQQQKQQVAIVVANASASSVDAAAADASVSRFDSAKSNATADSGIDSIGCSGDGPASLRQVGSPPKQPPPTLRRPSQVQPQQQQQQQQQQAHSVPKTSKISATSNNSSGNHNTSSSKKETKNEQKAAKTLSAILLVFILTWIPYNVFTLIKAVYRAYCPDEYFRPLIPETLYNFGYWLCYLNSTMNPVCYALCNANFRRTFWKILTCKNSNRRTLRHLGQGLYSHTRVVHAVTPAGARQPR